MRALVTGATGFVGSHLVDALLERGVAVTALARSSERASALKAQGVSIILGRLEDEPVLQRAAQNQDVLYHVAGAVSARSEAEFLRVNRDGTQMMVAAAQEARVERFVLVSSLAAAGPSTPGCALNGSETPHPVTAYGRSKLAGEEVVKASRLRWIILRPPMVYGPRDREVLKVFRAARLGIAPVFGDGTQQLSAVHAADLASALIAVAGASTTGRIYTPCHPEVFTSAEFVRAVGTAVGRSVRTLRVPAALGRLLLSVTEASARITGQTTILTADKANEFFQPAWTGDPGPLMRDCNWRPVYDLCSGLADTYQWYRKAGWL